jgi:hypothetical protein
MEPTTAERIRTVLARASSLTLTTGPQRYDLIGLHRVDERGQITLLPPDDSPLTAQVACAPRGALAALLEFTDIAPIAVRHRVRARVTLSGWVTPNSPADDSLRLDTARATLETDRELTAVGLDEIVLAQADPLAADEAALLTHLADAHEDVIAQLTRLADPRLLHGVVRVRPLALDRYGITLRCEYASRHRDVRFPFTTPVQDAGEVGGRVRTLLAAARACRHRRRTTTRR